MVDYIFKDSGIQQVEHVFLHNPAGVDAEARKGYLESAYRLGKEF